MFIRRVAAAFTLWALAICVWAALSHLASVPGPAKASTATLEGIAELVERADPPGSLRAPRFAAEQLRRTAHTAGRINGGIERAVGAWLDRLGHRAAHGPADVAVFDDGRITIRMDARSNVAGARVARVEGLGAMRIAARAPSPTRHGGLWIDRTVKAPAGSSEGDVRLRAARHGETFALRAAETGSALDEAEVRLDVDANLDREKIKKRLEKLLDLLEDLQKFEGGR
ncbi:MAG: hypothetical protein F4Z72_00115 [Gemmatimonadales bacterium]|uniref:hypothetical protein n=1 Tax=Candidatus Palauibacter irciniicola TaxID=3056733 RepID=UPI00138507B1|nr:hypothetical protein [Candidatus Palauibacter irciniicola]MYC17210.1 hypothetical protein [Gemmatimonadales bacterium]